MKAVPVPLVAHVIHALGTGGLENGLVNLINRMPRSRYRHAVVCMTTITDFRRRIERDDVEVVAMDRGSVPLWRTYIDLLQQFRRLRPSIVHTRNLSGLDALLPARAAGVGIRIHGEHGRDADDLQGSNRKYRRLRRVFRPLVTHYTAVSKDLTRYLTEQVGVRRDRITHICNGVDTMRFRPRRPGEMAPMWTPTASDDKLLVGAVGRLQPVKDHVTLVRAFAEALRTAPSAMRAAHLVIVGDGPSRGAIEAEIRREGLGDRATLAGERQDIAELLRSFDLFVLPSRDEGISNTVLEAMATGLPVLATRVGGNPETVIEGEVGQLVPAQDWRAMAAWIGRYAADPVLRRRHGTAGRSHVERSYGLQGMVDAYLGLYDRLSARQPADAANNIKKSTILP